MAPQRLEARFKLSRVLLLGGAGVLCLWGGLALALELRPELHNFWLGVGIVAALELGGAWLLWVVLGVGAGIVPGLVLDEHQLRHRLFGSVPWEKVEAIELTRFGVRCTLYLRLRPGGQVRRTGLARWLLPRKNHLLFPIEGFDQPPDEVLARAREFHQVATGASSAPQLSEDGRLLMAELEAMADAGAPDSELEAVMRKRTATVGAAVVEQFRLHEQARARRSRWANGIIILLLGLVLGWALFKLAPAFGWR